MNGGYFAWSGRSSWEHEHLSTSAAPATGSSSCNIIFNNHSNSNLIPAAAAAAPTSSSKASWMAPPAPDSYHLSSSLLDCTMCITQGHFIRYEGETLGQGSNKVFDGGELMQEDMHYNIEDEDETCLGIEMKMMKKRKLTNEQARELEASFEADKRLEAEKKQRLAEQLGLQPRQVAVWFQNRRARSKTKQLELDFLTLKSEYDHVLAQRRALQAEVAQLSAQLQARSVEAKNSSSSQESMSSTNLNIDGVSQSTTLQLKMASPTIENREGFSSELAEDFGGKSKDGIPKLQDLQKSQAINSYNWELYDNGLWVFD